MWVGRPDEQQHQICPTRRRGGAVVRVDRRRAPRRARSPGLLVVVGLQLDCVAESPNDFTRTIAAAAHESQPKSIRVRVQLYESALRLTVGPGEHVCVGPRRYGRPLAPADVTRVQQGRGDAGSAGSAAAAAAMVVAVAVVVVVVVAVQWFVQWWPARVARGSRHWWVTRHLQFGVHELDRCRRLRGDPLHLRNELPLLAGLL